MRLAVVAYTHSLSTQGAEAGCTQARGRPQLLKKVLVRVSEQNPIVSTCLHNGGPTVFQKQSLDFIFIFNILYWNISESNQYAYTTSTIKTLLPQTAHLKMNTYVYGCTLDLTSKFTIVIHVHCDKVITSQGLGSFALLLFSRTWRTRWVTTGAAVVSYYTVVILGMICEPRVLIKRMKTLFNIVIHILSF